ncbi:MAG: hypothetical protein HZA16_15125 [Nitrospirae bacterium]|nr:hypothetical protein [Nitrospirota bacterium]
MKKNRSLYFFLCALFCIPIVINNAFAQNLPSEKAPEQNGPQEKPPAVSVPLQRPFEPKAPQAQGQAAINIEKAAPGIFRIGEITINKKIGSVSFPARINMDKGLLEYLIVNKGGKTHESLLRTDVTPYDLQIAFLLIGFEGSDRPLKGQGDPERPKGEPVEITIAFNDKEDRTVQVKGEDWIIIKNKDEQRNVEKLDYVFTGSMVYNGQFLAQSSGSIAALYHDPAALIDNSSTGGESDDIWFVKEGAVPAVGTPVKVNIKAIGTRAKGPGRGIFKKEAQ